MAANRTARVQGGMRGVRRVVSLVACGTAEDRAVLAVLRTGNIPSLRHGTERAQCAAVAAPSGHVAEPGTSMASLAKRQSGLPWPGDRLLRHPA